VRLLKLRDANGSVVMVNGDSLLFIAQAFGANERGQPTAPILGQSIAILTGAVKVDLKGSPEAIAEQFEMLVN
jgi:hypothetical protein